MPPADNPTPSPLGDSALDLDKSVLNSSLSSVEADGSSYSTLSVSIYSKDGKPVEGLPIKVSSDRGETDLISPSESLTQTNGISNFTIKSKIQGRATISVTVGTGFTQVLPTKHSIQFVPTNLSLDKSYISLIPPRLPADNIATSLVTVQVKDTNLNSISGVQVSLNSNRGSGVDSITSVNSTTNGEGQAVFRVKSNTEGISTLTATITASGEVIGSSHDISFSNSPPSSLFASPTTSLSPGPAGSSLDRDYRINVGWITNDMAGLRFNPGNYARWLTVDGRLRYYQIHLPTNYEALGSTKFPILFTLHGGGGNPNSIIYNSRMDEISDANNFIVIYPAGTSSTDNPLSSSVPKARFTDRSLFWNSGPLRLDPKEQSVDDVKFISRVIEDCHLFFRINSKKIFATGLSNGGQMSFRLGSELSHLIAGIAPVSGDRTFEMYFPKPQHSIPILYIHGDGDSFLPIGGGLTYLEHTFANTNRPSIETSLFGSEYYKSWFEFSGAILSKTTSTSSGKVTQKKFFGLDGVKSNFEYWFIKDGGHTWPGGRTSLIEDSLGVGNVNTDVSGGQIIWNFFAQHELQN